MTAQSRTPARHADSGFTLVEVLIAATLALMLLSAVLVTLENFTSNAANQTKRTDANEQVRAMMDRVVSDLRQAATLEVAGATDLVYTVADAATEYRRERLCVDGAGRLWRSSVVTATAPATPIASGTACPTAGSGAAVVTRLTSRNSATNPLFTYDSATPGSVRSIGLTIALDAGKKGRMYTSTLRAGAFVRAKSETPLAVTKNDIGTSCSGNNGAPVLTLSASLGSYTVVYKDLDGNTLGSASAGAGVTLSSSTTTVVATVTASTGAVTQLLKTIAC